jgi:diphthine-ammonia ligase
MPESLRVIALISGGKDSIYSILHCLRNGHEVVALGNLHPPHPKPDGHVISDDQIDEQDLNSFMYQTVGHTVIPLYEEALGIPLYRQEILGGPVQTGTTYQPPAEGVDETESLIPLLKTVLAAHPEANALSTGAILSTYQRTRVESVAVRLGLVPLAYLWQYPTLPPGTQISLLEDLEHAQLDARIIKVASGGLDESFLWENVASGIGRRRVQKAMSRFGVDDNGSVLGEGGEFETLVIDGPAGLFKGKIVIDEVDREIVREGGGAAWLRIRKARVEKKITPPKQIWGWEYWGDPRIPPLFESKFKGTICEVDDELTPYKASLTASQPSPNTLESKPLSTKIFLKSSPKRISDERWTVVAPGRTIRNIADEVADIVDQMSSTFKEQNIKVSDVISTTIVLRSMSHFAFVNKVSHVFLLLFLKPLCRQL